MHKIKELIKQLSDDARGVEAVLELPIQELTDLSNRLSLFDTIIAATDLEISLNTLRESQTDEYNRIVLEEKKREDQNGIVIKSRLGVTRVGITVINVNVEEGIIKSGRIIREDSLDTPLVGGRVVGGEISGGHTLMNNIIKVDVIVMVIENGTVTAGTLVGSEVNVKGATITGGTLIETVEILRDVITEQILQEGTLLVQLFDENGDSLFKNIRLGLVDKVRGLNAIGINTAYNASLELQEGIRLISKHNLDKVPDLSEKISSIRGNLLKYNKVTQSEDPQFQYISKSKESYILEILEDKSTSLSTKRHYAIAKDKSGVVVMTGPVSYSSDVTILLNEIKFRLDNQLA